MIFKPRRSSGVARHKNLSLESMDCILFQGLDNSCNDSVSDSFGGSSQPHKVQKDGFLATVPSSAEEKKSFIDRYRCSTTKSSRLTFSWTSDLLNAEPCCVALYQERILHRPRPGHGCRKPPHIIIHTVRLRCVNTLVPFCLHPSLSLKDETPHSVGFPGRRFFPRPGAPKVQKRPRQRLRNLWRQCHFRLRRGRRRDRRVGPGIVRSLPTFLPVIFAHLYR